MRALTLAVSSREETNRRFLQACEGKPQGNLLTFESPSLLFTLLTAERWDLLKMMTGAGAITVREAAEKVEKGIRAVQDDVDALLMAGILRKKNNDEIEFPFDAVHVDFMLKAS
ncbi:MAG: transcriptional regulator [Candidatus Electrothrix aestuarii]|uniref:Transcriptional regulator n=1 Tax=Candidatus Electrothrix aestuarii TaxID=3062594 RepID=A0AAU8LWQ2_9BACT|nr:DNA-binding protein [Candidatus Electrothrix aestuarii]